MNEEQIKLALKHKLAVAYSVELVSLGREVPAIVDRAFDLAAAMIKRMDEELTALNAKADQPEPQEDLVNVLMAALMKSARG